MSQATDMGTCCLCQGYPVQLWCQHTESYSKMHERPETSRLLYPEPYSKLGFSCFENISTSAEEVRVSEKEQG